MFVLHIKTGPTAGQTVNVKDQMILGRSPDCDYAILDGSISRRHLRFALQATSLLIHDLNSSNGTFVNEVRIEGKFEVRHGDTIRVGDVSFEIENKAAPQTRQSSQALQSIVMTQTMQPQHKAPEMLGKLGMTMFGFVDPGPAKHEIITTSSSSEVGQANAAQLEKRLQAVLKMSEALGNIRSAEEVFHKILEILFEVFPQSVRGFLLLGSSVEDLHPVAARDKKGQNVSGKIDVSRSIVGKALREKTAVLYIDGDNSFDQKLSMAALEIRSAMVVPLVVKDEILGVLSLDTDNIAKSFKPDDLAIASAAASQASVALKNALLNEKIESDALVKQNLCRFLPGPLAAQAMEGKLDLKLGGSRARGTIFFSDVVGFTTMAETRSPEEVVAVLNAYFDIMVTVISDNHGAIDKYLGDAIMAFWGIPLDQDGQAAKNACLAGLQMQTALWLFNYELIAQGKNPLQHGIGINTGDVVAGNIGSSRRVEYTVIGDNVNLAQRLESRAAKSQVLISESTWQDTKGQVFGVTLAPSKVKGKKEAVSILSLRGVVKHQLGTWLHIPLMGADSVPVLLSELELDRTTLNPTLIVVHPVGHMLPETLQPELPELPELPAFRFQVLSSEEIVEGAQGQRRYQKSRIVAIDLEPRLATLLYQHESLQSSFDLDSIKRH